MRAYILVALVPLLLVAEPSAFEQQSGATKNDIRTLQNLVAKLQQRVDTLQQSQEGVSSLYESQSSKLQQQIAQGVQLTKDIDEIKVQIELYKNLKQQLDSNTQDIKTIQTQIKELSSSFKTLNQSILDELKTLNVHTGNVEMGTQQETKSGEIKEAIPFAKDKNKRGDIFAQARQMLQKSDFLNAKLRFEWLLESKYKLADSHFYLGEIAFAEKSYSAAIAHYKESVMANDKAKYMPTLLLHTAQSFNAIKDTKNYNKFLDSLIASYPTSKEAQEAKKIKNQNKDKK